MAEARHQEALNRALMGWPVFYHNHLLFDEPLQMRGDSDRTACRTPPQGPHQASRGA